MTKMAVTTDQSWNATYLNVQTCTFIMETEEFVTLPAASVKDISESTFTTPVLLHGSTFKQIALTFGRPMLY